MAAFNSMPVMTPGAAPNEVMAMGHPAGQHMTMEHMDQEINFDEALL